MNIISSGSGDQSENDAGVFEPPAGFFESRLFYLLDGYNSRQLNDDELVEIESLLRSDAEIRKANAFVHGIESRPLGRFGGSSELEQLETDDLERLATNLKQRICNAIDECFREYIDGHREHTGKNSDARDAR